METFDSGYQTSRCQIGSGQIGGGQISGQISGDPANRG
jgi:hypothetical protein